MDRWSSWRTASPWTPSRRPRGRRSGTRPKGRREALPLSVRRRRPRAVARSAGIRSGSGCARTCGRWSGCGGHARRGGSTGSARGNCARKRRIPTRGPCLPRRSGGRGKRSGGLSRAPSCRCRCCRRGRTGCGRRHRTAGAREGKRRSNCASSGTVTTAARRTACGTSGRPSARWIRNGCPMRSTRPSGSCRAPADRAREAGRPPGGARPFSRRRRGGWSTAPPGSSGPAPKPRPRGGPRGTRSSPGSPGPPPRSAPLPRRARLAGTAAGVRPARRRGRPPAMPRTAPAWRRRSPRGAGMSSSSAVWGELPGRFCCGASTRQEGTPASPACSVPTARPPARACGVAPSRAAGPGRRPRRVRRDPRDRRDSPAGSRAAPGDGSRQGRRSRSSPAG